MKKFDGILICSDVDGTLAIERNVIEKNLDAVKYFTDNGGRFTIATGRTAEYLRDMDFFGCINAPVCTCNGSLVYDYGTERVLREMHEDFTLGEFLESTKDWHNRFLGLYVYFSHETALAPNTVNLDFTPEELSAKPIKLVCHLKTMEDAGDFKEYARSLPVFGDTYIAYSWDTGVEFNPIGGTKGDAAVFIKNHLGDIHTLVAIGDYENDIPLLKMADISASVENALPEVKANADMVLCHVTEGAVSELIDILDNRCK